MDYRWANEILSVQYNIIQLPFSFGLISKFYYTYRQIYSTIKLYGCRRSVMFKVAHIFCAIRVVILFAPCPATVEQN